MTSRQTVLRWAKNSLTPPAVTLTQSPSVCCGNTNWTSNSTTTSSTLSPPSVTRRYVTRAKSKWKLLMTRYEKTHTHTHTHCHCNVIEVGPRKEGVKRVLRGKLFYSSVMWWQEHGECEDTTWFVFAFCYDTMHECVCVCMYFSSVCVCLYVCKSRSYVWTSISECTELIQGCIPHGHCAVHRCRPSLMHLCKWVLGVFDALIKYMHTFYSQLWHLYLSVIVSHSSSTWSSSFAFLLLFFVVVCVIYQRLYVHLFRLIPSRIRILIWLYFICSLQLYARLKKSS